MRKKINSKKDRLANIGILSAHISMINSILFLVCVLISVASLILVLSNISIMETNIASENMFSLFINTLGLLFIAIIGAVLGGIFYRKREEYCEIFKECRRQYNNIK